MCYGINCLLFRNGVVNGSGMSTITARAKPFQQIVIAYCIKINLEFFLCH